MTHRPLVKARQGWRIWVDSDRGLTALLLFLVAYGFFIYPLACAKETTNPLAASAFSVVLVLGVLATTQHKGIRMGMVILAVFAFTSRWLHLLIQAHAVHVIAASASILFFSVLSFLIIQRVFSGGGITIFRICGAMAVYVILGILWGELFVLVYLFDPSSFYFQPASQFGEPPVSELLYFSFTTLTTLGVGDILPVHPMARSLTTLEALVGQLYPAVLLARLVTLYNK
jgi:hypothetical protein